MDMDPVRQPSTYATGDRRDDRRAYEVTVRFRSGIRRASVRMRDISRFGARVAGVFLVHEGDRLFLALPGLAPVEAKVAWVNAFEFGCEFTTPLNPAVFDALINGTLTDTTKKKK